MKIFDKITKKKSAAIKAKADKEKTDKPVEDAKKVKDVKTDAKKSMKDLYSGEAGKVKTAGSGKKGTKGKTARAGRAYRVLSKPLITEKAGNLGALGKYFFAVENSANKIEIGKAVLEVYGIKPIKVNVVSMYGKKTRSGKITGKRKDWKKAIVTLPKGKSINLYEGV